MYWRRILALLVVAGGTVALAGAISKYKPHLRRLGTTVALSPEDQPLPMNPQELDRYVRKLAVPEKLPANPELLRLTLARAFRGFEVTTSFVKQQREAIFYVAGIKLPVSAEQRILVYYVMEDEKKVAAFYKIDDFTMPAAQRIETLRLENGQVVFSDRTGDLLSRPFELP